MSTGLVLSSSVMIKVVRFKTVSRVSVVLFQIYCFIQQCIIVICITSLLVYILYYYSLYEILWLCSSFCSAILFFTLFLLLNFILRVARANTLFIYFFRLTMVNYFKHNISTCSINFFF